MEICELAGAGDLSDEARAERDSLTKSATARSSFGLNDQLAGRVFEDADADVIVGQPGFELLRDFCKHFVRIQSGNRVARNGIQQRKMARFGAFFLEEPRVFYGDASFAGEHTHQFEMALVKNALVFGEDGHRADGVI